MSLWPEVTLHLNDRKRMNEKRVELISLCTFKTWSYLFHRVNLTNLRLRNHNPAGVTEFVGF